jgi:hypothetical protein
MERHEIFFGSESIEYSALIKIPIQEKKIFLEDWKESAIG